MKARREERIRRGILIFLFFVTNRALPSGRSGHIKHRIEYTTMAYQLIHPIVGRDIASIISSYNVDDNEVDYVVESFLDHLREMNRYNGFLVMSVFELCRVKGYAGWVRGSGDLMRISSEAYDAVCNQNYESQTNMRILMDSNWLGGNDMILGICCITWANSVLEENVEAVGWDRRDLVESMEWAYDDRHY